VNRVVPQTDVLEAAVALAESICHNAPLAVQASKRVAVGLVDSRIPADDEAWELSSEQFRVLMTSHDAVEGPSAFAEKRTPIWTGR
jgi:crotonobetainyl-CoA hydratase